MNEMQQTLLATSRASNPRSSPTAGCRRARASRWCSPTRATGRRSRRRYAPSSRAGERERSRSRIRELRALALHTLQEEGFAAEVAATLATLTPRRHRTAAIRGIVALEVMYDYLDGLTEQPTPDPLANGRQLFKAFTDALDPSGQPDEDYYRHHPCGSDGGYLQELAATVSEALACLPKAGALAPAMLRRSRTLRGSGGADPRRDPQRQSAGRAMGQSDDERLGPRLARVSGGRRVLGAGRPRADSARRGRAHHRAACRADRRGLPGVGGSQHDARQRRRLRAGRRGWHARVTSTTTATARCSASAWSTSPNAAAMRARDAPASAHHLMTLAGIAAYYTSAPSAASELALAGDQPHPKGAAAADHADARGDAHLAAGQAGTCTLPRQLTTHAHPYK